MMLNRSEKQLIRSQWDGWRLRWRPDGSVVGKFWESKPWALLYPIGEARQHVDRLKRGDTTMPQPYTFKKNSQYLHDSEREEAKKVIQRLRASGAHPRDVALKAGITCSAVYAWYAGSQLPNQKSYAKLKTYLSSQQPNTP
jgi:hypothetical protein